jgi:predicted O-linked N-acetylglucosamine transferase (SPINDLY family)
MTDIGEMLREAIVHHQVGRLAAAEEIYRRVLAIDPRQPDALNLLGVLAGQVGHFDAGLQLIDQSLRVRDDANVHYNRADVLWRMARTQEAVEGLRRAIELNPSFAKAHADLGLLLGQSGDLQAAEAILRKAIELDPNSPTPHVNLGLALMQLDRFDEALECYYRAQSLGGDSATLHFNLACVLERVGRKNEALAALQRTLEREPRHSPALANVGKLLSDRGEAAESVAAYRAAMEIAPLSPLVHSNMLLIMHYDAQTTPAQMFAAHVQYGHQHARSVKQIAVTDVDADPQRRLRIGFVSPDLHEHPIGHFLPPVLLHLPREEFEISCYSGWVGSDAINELLRARSDRWRDVAHLSDPQLAEVIRDDKIDILIDLTGHTAGSRLLAFAAKPAPVQMAQFGYPDTTGVDAIDYRITDAISDPVGNERYYTEKLIRLPEVAWCYEPMSSAPAPTSLPADAAGYVTFGSLNNPAKMSDDSLRTWAAILEATPFSRLIMRAPQGAGGEALMQERLRRHGIDPARVELVGELPREKYLQVYNRIDIGLDPFPYNGGVTTCDALWMGVPVIALTGETYVARQGKMIVTGLAELIAADHSEYIRIATALAADRERLVEVRRSLRQRFEQSPMMQGERYARHLGDAYRTAWRGWCATRATPLL